MHRVLTSRRRSLAILLALACVAGCYKLPPEGRIGEPASFSQAPPPAEQPLGEMRWGLALSGGGIRAALFSMGVMKGLYDARLMDSIQVISSVSGGGYTAYWLYTREYSNPSPVNNFGQNTFEDEPFREGMCDVELTSNLYSYREMARTASARSETFPQGYEYALLRTFGHAVQAWGEDGYLTDRGKPIQVHHLAPAVRAGTLPYFILNAIVVDPDPRLGWKDGLYEFTPFFSGNEAFGYQPWSRDSSVFLRKAFAISGAAVRGGLKQSIPNPHASLGRDEITLADAGKAENLGAITLVRRRVQNIIIVDAGLDPNYKFKAYTNLQTRLRRWGYALYIPSIELRSSRRRLATGTHVGVVRSTTPGDPFSANIYYIKMSIPVSLDATINDSVTAERGAEINAAVTDMLESTETLSSDEWDCGILRGWSYDLRKRFIHKVYAYTFARGNGRYPTVFNPLPTVFPQYTTLDQSFFRDQSVAFVGLGYFQAEEMASMLSGRGQTGRR
jgi:hypothetical protein